MKNMENQQKENENLEKQNIETNHKLAVALKYDKSKLAPFIIAKGNQHLAEKIFKLAKENQIPIVTDENLVKVLSVVDIGSCIPENTYKAVATIFTFLEKFK